MNVQPDPSGPLHHAQVQAVRCAEELAAMGYDVSIRAYPPVGHDEYQPDPVVDVWRSSPWRVSLESVELAADTAGPRP